ncbi:uncharacterized protein MONBRDRAFT_30938 [Monosiga brevicollis MX1]|uniref:Ribosome biogenesis protein NOP53 n=1 Tax=Monosiga brevicollis TaxID=81824 RepID=A9UQA6_MONBE|nr:uncharacterized protein MONBRDRAFT_30938 [Monosiga brevicollis MX1]EDQ93014.1 predicted protein [Monosiga brevicollis MX1]|eukprot:XP_001742776.1 hypothetical protein [Monosiga brevicollis MX1]
MTTVVRAKADGTFEEVSAHKLRRKQRGKRSDKKNMRKHIDMSAVEDAIDQRRFEERTGADDLKSKSDDQLFQLDTGSAPAAKPVRLGRKARAASKVLRVDQVVAPNPNIKPVVSLPKKNTEYSLEKEIKAKKIKPAQPNTAAPPSQEEEADPETTVWDETQEDPTNGNPFLQHLQPSSVAIPDSVHKPHASKTKVVEPCHPGQSYNPLATDHHSLLETATDIEVKAERARNRVRKQLPENLSKSASNYKMMEQLQEGLSEFVQPITLEEQDAKSASNQDDDEDEDDAEAAKRQDIKSKRKERSEAAKQHDERVAAHRAKKSQAKLAKDLDRLDAINSEIRNAERKQRTKATARAAVKAQRQLEPRKLSKYEFKKPKPEIKLTEELEGSLRRLAPEGNLVKDRLNNLVMRNIVEYRREANPRRRYQQKEVTTRSRKNFELQFDLNKEQAKRSAKAQEAEEALELKRQEKKQVDRLARLTQRQKHNKHKAKRNGGTSGSNAAKSAKLSKM